MKKIFLFIFFSSICCCLPVCMKRLNHGFRLEKMKLDFPFQSEWEVSHLSQEFVEQFPKLLSQSFHYLDRGAQSYVFESEDGLYVIKLFRFDQPQNPIRKFFRKEIRKRRSECDRFEKISHLFSACKLAYTSAQEETGLLYLHLNLTENQLPKVEFRGPLGRSFILDLDSYRFAVQKKAKPFEDVLVASLSDGNLKEPLDAIFSLLSSRVSKGIGNSDGNLFRNFGFIDKKAIEIDFGNYGYSEDLFFSAPRKKEVGRFVRSLRSWLEVNAPSWVDYLNQKMDEI